MNTEHTPGPWKAAGPLCTHIIDSRRILIAYAPHFRDMTRKEGFANRDLIAAAPDLLAALKQVVADGCATVYAHGYDEAGAMGCCGELTYRPHAESCWMVRARAAIAKAEGKA